MDIQIELPAVKASDLTLPPPREGSAEVRKRVATARAIQKERFASLGKPQFRINAEADGALLEDIAAPDANGMKLLREAADAMSLSARGYHRVLRVRWRGPHSCGRGLELPPAPRFVPSGGLRVGSPQAPPVKLWQTLRATVRQHVAQGG
jgi:hypothetical protein